MISAKRTDKQRIIEMLASAFDKNLSVNYIVKQDSKRKQRICALMDYSFEMCYRFGEVWLSDDRKACALMLYPHLKQTTFYSVWLDVKLVFSAIGINRIGKALDRENKIKTFQPKLPMAYLWFIGVNPLYQHRGTGSLLLQEILAHAAGLGLPVCLETSTERNLPWYEKHGFASYATLDLGYVLHFLKYEPVK